MNLLSLIIIGDILVCGMIIGIFVWLNCKVSDEKIAEAANLPFADPEEQQ